MARPIIERLLLKHSRCQAVPAALGCQPGRANFRQNVMHAAPHISIHTAGLTGHRSSAQQKSASSSSQPTKSGSQTLHLVLNGVTHPQLSRAAFRVWLHRIATGKACRCYNLAVHLVNTTIFAVAGSTDSSMELPSTNDDQIAQFNAEYQAAFNAGSQDELEAAKCR